MISLWMGEKSSESYDNYESIALCCPFEATVSRVLMSPVENTGVRLVEFIRRWMPPSKAVPVRDCLLLLAKQQ